jgi:hypothetical protein
MKLRFFTVLFLAPFIGIAAEIPEATIPAGVGVNIHFVTGQARDLDLIAAAGFKFVRMDFAWAGIERKKGDYDWANYEQLLSNLEKRGLRALYILDYSNPLYEADNASPQRPESVEAFASWAGAAAKHFRGRHVIWEVWNEPNISFWRPKPDVQQYATLCLAACKAIRQCDPNATIIGPASSEFPWNFLETVFKSGALEYLDAVSVHPYRDYRRGPETAAADYQKLRELITRYVPAARKKTLPILSGEWGYATHQKGVPLQTQADFAVRQLISILLDGVPISFCYYCKNDGPDSNNGEHNFGTVFQDLSPKPSYLAIRKLTSELRGFKISRRLPLASEKDYVLVCSNSKGEEKLAAWTTESTHQATFQIGPETEKARRTVTGTGPGFPQKLEKGRLTLELNPSPQYITLGAIRTKTN